MKQKFHIGKKATAIATAGAFVVAMGVPQIGGLTAASAESMSADGYVTAAACRAAQPAPEILGLSGVEETGASTGAAAYGVQEWDNPKYYIMGDATYNSNPNPYMVNAVAVVNGTDPDASPTIVQNTARNGGGRGPMGALAPYGVGSDNDDAVWDMAPDVVVGIGTANGGTADYTSAEYAGAAAEANGWTSYSPIGVEYLTASNTNIVKEMYELAEAGDDVVENSNGTKQLRYGSAVDIAKDFERYMVGTQGYILKAIESGTVSKKTVAAVSSYDEASGTFTLLKSGVAEGTASSNKLLEACEQVANNLPEVLGKTTATADELAQYADAIVIGGQSGGAGEALTDPNAIVAKMSDALVAKTYYVDSSKDNPGSMYGVVMNSVENTQNIGRVLGFVYPEVVDQDDWMCYYYDKFYHIKSDKLAEVIDKAMDGVRNADATDASNYLNWTEADASTYNAEEVQGKIAEGVVYLLNYEGTLSDPLTPTAYLSDDVDIMNATVDDIAPVAYDGTEKTPAPVVKLNGRTLKADTDYTLEYKNNKEKGTATITITGNGDYMGTTTTTFEIKTDFSQATVDSIPAQTYTGSAITPDLNVTLNGVTLEEGTDYTSSYDSNVNVGTATVTLTGTGDYAGTKTATFTIEAASISQATVDTIATQTYTGKAITPKPTVKANGTTLVEGTDYTLSYANNTNVGTATVTITGKGNYKDSTQASFTIKEAPGDKAWKRLYGRNALVTMKAIVNEGWSSSKYAIVATSSGYYDALSASGLAGLLDCPILLTKQSSLSDEASALITSKGVKNVIVVGGTAAVSDDVVSQIKKLGASVERVAGRNAVSTANKVYDYGNTLLKNGTIKTGWGKDAIVATGSGFQDALSIAPYSYAKGAPIFLTQGNPGTLADATKSRLSAGGFTRTVIPGGTAAVASSVDNQVTNAKRLAGNTAYGTSRKVADFCISEGMTAAHMGVATGRDYHDALCGAALCGKKNSVLILADDKSSSTVDNVVKPHKYELQENCYIFGGTAAVSSNVENTIKTASK